MGTVIRAEVSRNSKYYINKHRYYELKHYCMQYDLWKKELYSINVYPDPMHECKSNKPSNPTQSLVEKREQYVNKIRMLEKVANAVDPVIGPYVLQGIITGSSYDVLNTQMCIPCCKDVYYATYRKFFWVLDKVRR